LTGSRPPRSAPSVVDAFTAGVAELDVIHDRAVDEFEELNAIVGIAVSKARCMASRTSANCRESSSGGRPQELLVLLVLLPLMHSSNRLPSG